MARWVLGTIGALVALSAGLIAARAVGTTPRAAAYRRGSLPLRAACREAGVRYPPPALRIVLRKADRLLGLYSGAKLVKEYLVALGPSPAGTKERQGDGRTPCGDLYVCTRLEHSRFRRFLGLSYPAPADARQGLKSRLVTRAQHDAILRAWTDRSQPPWNTPLGGAIGIHGGGTGPDWTLGCIALENPAIDELFAVCPLGTPVHIE